MCLSDTTHREGLFQLGSTFLCAYIRKRSYSSEFWPAAKPGKCRISMTDSMQLATDSENRYHALDAVRAFALLLGVVFHAAESFGPDAFRYPAGPVWGW